jgi:uncharacterized protein
MRGRLMAVPLFVAIALGATIFVGPAVVHAMDAADCRITQIGISDPEACYKLGILQIRSSDQATQHSGILWLKMAAGQGYPDAVNYLREEAEKGSTGAQWVLSNMYAEGAGVLQDYEEAVKWYRRGAEKGHTGFQYKLGLSYAEGKGVPQDYVQAHKWFNLAASGQGAKVEQKRRDLFAEVFEPPAKAVSWEAVSNRDTVAKRMTPAQIAEAQRMAREWLQQHRLQQHRKAGQQ